MVMRVVDHNDPAYAERYRRTKRENGAVTYSRDIVRWHLPVWEAWAADRQLDIVVGTCAALEDGPEPVRVQYLHTMEPSRLWVPEIRAGRRDIYVTSYQQQAADLRRQGREAIWLPMGVDVKAIERYRLPLGNGGPVAAYFGNVTAPKRQEYTRLKLAFEAEGWRLHHVWTDDSVDAWRRLAGYHYGVGVGRCALEMGALGMRVMISGARFGGLMTTAQEIAIQVASNMNGRVTTFDADPSYCLANFNRALPGITRDVSGAVERLHDLLRYLS